MYVNNPHSELPTVKESQDVLTESFARKLSISSLSSPSVDIHGQAVPSDILVALLDRPAEMVQLVSRNRQFYDAIQHYITETQGEHAWQRFQEILYKPREKLPDRVWLTCISHYLAHNSIFLSKFKEIVGYTEDTPDTISPPFHYKMSTSSSTASSNTSRRRSRRLSARSFDLDWPEEDSIIEEEAPEVPEGMFTDEEQFYQQTTPVGQQQPRRRRSSYHAFQSEPHPTFVESKIDEVEEAEVESGNESDHLSELLDNDEEDDDDYNSEANSQRISHDSSRQPTFKDRTRNNMGLVRVRDYPDVQTSLPNVYPAFFRKAKQILSLAPSSHQFSANVRRNSILEGGMPASPVIDLDEPRVQTCSDNEEDEENDHLTQLICTTRRQQPDDYLWLNNVIEVLGDWPELVDGLKDIIDDALIDHRQSR